MAAVPQKNSLPEIALRKEMHRRGYRYRLHPKSLPGRPDFVFPSRRIAVFVHGCFWHRHLGCPKATTPKTNAEFWDAKFMANIERDARKEAAIVDRGWSVVVVWECQIKTSLGAAADALQAHLLDTPDGGRNEPNRSGISSPTERDRRAARDAQPT